jgi:hypothetical protein
VFIGDDAVFLVYADGTVKPLLAGGHPRPGAAHCTSTRRP